MTVRETRLSGSYAEIGRQCRAQLKAVHFSPPPTGEEKREFMRASEPSVAAHAPYLLEELDSLAQTGGWDVSPDKAQMTHSLGFHGP